MAHAQQQILDAIKAVLDTGAIVAAGRVFLDRVDPLEAGELPAILVEEEPEGDSVEPETIHGLEQRELAVNVTLVIAHSSGAAAMARELGLQAEKAIAGSTALPGLCKGGVQLATSRQLNTGELDRLMAARQQTWRMRYLVRAQTPDVIA